MGITLTANNSKYAFDMGAGGFFNLRANIADAYDKQFGKHYRKLLECHDKKDYEEYDRIANEILSSPRFDKDTDLLDFFYASDIEGSISYKTAGKIYDIIKDVDFGNKCFQYMAYAHDDYGELKLFLKECYSHRRTVYWR